VKGKCSRLNVLIVAETQRFHFNQKKTGQYIVTNARALIKNIEDDSKAMIEERMKSRPLESAAMIFVAGVILGILIGSARRR
jgi:hypothetical protein